MSAPASSHAYGIGVIALIIGMGAVIVFYTSFWLPESLEKPSVDIHILEPTENFLISIAEGAATEGNPSYVPNSPKITLTIDNHVIWMNDDV
ncbi:MAG: copper-binding protein, partial [Nitrosopumilus sp.]|nr:copper-binding protein [Nitrosopumilus sp.]